MLEIVRRLVSLYELILVVRVLLSWIQPRSDNPVVRWVEVLTEPVLAPVRRMLPANSMGLDFSALLVLLALHFLKSLLLRGGMGW